MQDQVPGSTSYGEKSGMTPTQVIPLRFLSVKKEKSWCLLGPGPLTGQREEEGKLVGRRTLRVRTEK